MTLTVPTLWLVLPLVVAVVGAVLALCRYADRRWFDPWLKRRCGVPDPEEATND